MTPHKINETYPYVMNSAPGPITVINGKEMLYFGGVGYFQLHNHPDVIKAACEATMMYGISSATSRAYVGMTPLHYEVECKAAEFFGTEDAVYLPSGFLSNVAGMQALYEMGKFDTIFIDEFAHYCNKDGAYSVGCPVHKFKNNDPRNLEEQINKNLKPGEKPLIATDGLFSVYGYLARIPELLKIAEKHDATLWIDDAHNSGVIGTKGRGAYEYFGLDSPRLFFGTTLSKAFGGFGGVIPGTAEFISSVRKTGVMNGATQPPAAAAAACLKGLELVTANPQWRELLGSNARYLKTRLNVIGVKVEINDFPMTAFSLNDTDSLKQIHSILIERGIFIQLSNYVGANKQGALRMVVFSTHTKEQIDQLIDALAILLRGIV
ncbi:MAG: aminotransferase class I/II-fold pyridoxal phosphate-dependent enzyme [Thermoguttaceae bacterium]